MVRSFKSFRMCLNFKVEVFRSSYRKGGIIWEKREIVIKERNHVRHVEYDKHVFK
jgi:hypothetical protein